MSNDNNNQENTEDYFDFKKEAIKYLFFWRWFVLSITVCLIISISLIRYSHNVYSTSAKIKILEKSNSSLSLPSIDDLFSNSKINLENEIELLSSNSILSNVVKELNLNTTFYGLGNITKRQLVKFPFEYEQLILNDSIKEDLEFK